ncbi:hypothetical protein CR513_25065, partial [Mucuna pruriens]
MKGKSFVLDPMKEEKKAFSTTAITTTSSAKQAKTHSITRPPPSAGAVKDVDRKVIRRSGTHKEDTQRQGLKRLHANITTEEPPRQGGVLRTVFGCCIVLGRVQNTKVVVPNTAAAIYHKLDK